MKAWLPCCVITLCFLVQGCSSGTVTPPPDPPAPPTPPANLVKIVSPTSNATLSAFPVSIQVSFASGSDPASMQALLDGVDVTSSFSVADASGVRSGKFSRPQINLGKNQILVNAGTQQARADFFVTTLAAPASTASMPLLVPIKTRVVRNDGSKATDYFVEVDVDSNNPLMIQSPTPSDGSARGFQLVYLSRTDLSVVPGGNIAVTNTPTSGKFLTGPLFMALANTPSGCGTAGCILVMQSLGTIGYTPCSSDQFNNSDCSYMTIALSGLSASGRVACAEGNSSHVAFSYIGNTALNLGGPSPGNLVGTFFESLTCNSSNYGSTIDCDSLGYPNTSFTAPTGAPPSALGKISGALVRDNYNNYTFAQSAPPVSFSSSTDPSGLSHTFTIDGTTYSSTSLGGIQGGIHLLILNRKDLTLEFQGTYPSSADGSASEAVQVANEINGYKSYGNLFSSAHSVTPLTSGPVALIGTFSPK